MIVFGDIVLDDLDRAARGEPVIASERGSLFLLPDQSAGAARLNGTVAEYEAFLRSLDDDRRPEPRWIVPVRGRTFHMMIDAPVTVCRGKTFVGEREVVFL
jgi:hypothetical protein